LKIYRRITDDSGLSSSLSASHSPHWLLVPSVIPGITVLPDVDAFTFKHVCEGAGAAADLYSRAAELLECFDTRPVDEEDPCQVETHRRGGPKKTGALVLQQGGPLGDNVPLEPKRRSQPRSNLACDP